MKRQKVLFVDDNAYNSSFYVLAIEDKGYEVAEARTVDEAKQKLESEGFDLAVIDINLPPPQSGHHVGGPRMGQVLGVWIKNRYPGIKLIGVSELTFHEEARWFTENGDGFVEKGDPKDLAQYLAQALEGTIGLKSFIVHGHDETTKLELKNFLQNRLYLAEPIILHEMPSVGRTVIEKFEDYADEVDLVFVLLTPDDRATGKHESNAIKRRARQNVIFEMGYFLGRLRRRRGAVILLYKGNPELPSDISGLIPIDISNGIESAAESIRREIAAFRERHAR